MIKKNFILDENFIPQKVDCHQSTVVYWGCTRCHADNTSDLYVGPKVRNCSECGFPHELKITSNSDPLTEKYK